MKMNSELGFQVREMINPGDMTVFFGIEQYGKYRGSQLPEIQENGYAHDRKRGRISFMREDLDVVIQADNIGGARLGKSLIEALGIEERVFVPSIGFLGSYFTFAQEEFAEYKELLAKHKELSDQLIIEMGELGEGVHSFRIRNPYDDIIPEKKHYYLSVSSPFVSFLWDRYEDQIQDSGRECWFTGGTFFAVLGRINDAVKGFNQ